MTKERSKNQPQKRRPSTTITLRIPVDMVNELKAVAPQRGFTGYQALLKSYISQGLQRDGDEFIQQATQRLAVSLRRRGMEEKKVEKLIKKLRSEVNKAREERLRLQ